MEMTARIARRPVSPVLLTWCGLALLALAFYAAIVASAAIVAALAGAAGLGLLRSARAERPYSNALIAIDAAAFAIFAIQRNDALGFWQLPGPWGDVWRFDVAGVTIALIVYVGGSVMALIGGFRGLQLIEALSLIAIPFLFNLLVTIAADWHMAEIGAFASGRANIPFAAQVAIGRALTLWFLGEAILTLLSLTAVNRVSSSWRVHALLALSGAVAAVTPAGRQRRAGGRAAVLGDLRLQPLRRTRARRAYGRSSIF